jgi:uncharacterized protein (TIGR00725 family)
VPRTLIGVMGAGERATPQAVRWAEELGALIAAEGWGLLSGGRDAGVMGAVSRGAQKAGGLVVGVLPSVDGAEASPHVDVAIVTGMGSARNNVNVLSSHVVVACGNAEAGTLSEIALALKAGKPVVLLTEDAEARRFLERTGGGSLRSASSPEEAVALG